MAAQSNSISAITAVVVLILAGGLTLTTARRCKVSCVRQPDVQSFGFDPLKRQVEIDVGKCQEEYNSAEDCEVPIPSTTQCTRACQPRSYEMISDNNRSGPLSVQIVRACFATRHHCHTHCDLKPNYVYMFPNSRHQTRVDVGKCVGTCINNTEGSDCVAVRYTAEVVQGPNGPTAVDKIVSCSCRNTSCYRVDHFDSFWDYGHGLNTNNSSRRQEKVINIGKCVGGCTGVYLPDTCYPSPTDCQLRVRGKQAKCVPTLGRGFNITDDRGHTREIAAVSQCGCSTG